MFADATKPVMHLTVRTLYIIQLFSSERTNAMKYIIPYKHKHHLKRIHKERRKRIKLIMPKLKRIGNLFETMCAPDFAKAMKAFIINAANSPSRNHIYYAPYHTVLNKPLVIE
jgi:hypothetical protein